MNLYDFDHDYREIGRGVICGVDEAGRGPLAGPVYAAAVILNPDAEIDGVRDSKKITAKKRARLCEEIKQKALAWSVAYASRDEIDEYNIRQATLLAMRRAVSALAIRPDLVLVDGRDDPFLDIPTELVVRGDAASACVAAASILAKVSRDAVMLEIDSRYPQYEFSRHKGYGTRLHFELLDKHGPCPEHRRSFLKKWEAARDGR